MKILSDDNWIGANMIASEFIDGKAKYKVKGMAHDFGPIDRLTVTPIQWPFKVRKRPVGQGQ